MHDIWTKVLDAFITHQNLGNFCFDKVAHWREIFLAIITIWVCPNVWRVHGDYSKQNPLLYSNICRRGNFSLRIWTYHALSRSDFSDVLNWNCCNHCCSNQCSAYNDLRFYQYSATVCTVASGYTTKQSWHSFSNFFFLNNTCVFTFWVIYFWGYMSLKPIARLYTENNSVKRQPYKFLSHVHWHTISGLAYQMGASVISFSIETIVAVRC